MATIPGGAFSDFLFGTSLSDFIAAGAGHDTVMSGSGDDIVHGEAGDDLLNGGAKDWDLNPYPALGRRAFQAADTRFALGSAGAGTGAMTANWKGGLGSASAVLDNAATVGALVAVNAVGSVTAPGGRFWAAPWELGDEFGGLGLAGVLVHLVARLRGGFPVRTSHHSRYIPFLAWSR